MELLFTWSRGRALLLERPTEKAIPGLMREAARSPANVNQHQMRRSRLRADEDEEMRQGWCLTIDWPRGNDRFPGKSKIFDIYDPIVIIIIIIIITIITTLWDIPHLNFDTKRAE